MNWLVLSYFLTAGLNIQHNVAIQDASGYHYWQPPTTPLKRPSVRNCLLPITCSLRPR